MKVFCNDCKHFFDEEAAMGNLYHRCKADPHLVETPLYQYVVYGDPTKINKDNDCPKFEKRFRLRDLFKRQQDGNSN